MMPLVRIGRSAADAARENKRSGPVDQGALEANHAGTDRRGRLHTVVSIGMSPPYDVRVLSPDGRVETLATQSVVIITAAQCRAARAILGWTRRDLGELSSSSVTVITALEKEKREVNEFAQRKIQAALEAAGIAFIDLTGVNYAASSEAARVAAKCNGV